MDKEDWKELEQEIMLEGAASLIGKYEREIAVLTDKVQELRAYLERRKLQTEKR